MQAMSKYRPYRPRLLTSHSAIFSRCGAADTTPAAFLRRALGAANDCRILGPPLSSKTWVQASIPALIELSREQYALNALKCNVLACKLVPYLCIFTCGPAACLADSECCVKDNTLVVVVVSTAAACRPCCGDRSPSLSSIRALGLSMSVGPRSLHPTKNQFSSRA